MKKKVCVSFLLKKEGEKNENEEKRQFKNEKKGGLYSEKTLYFSRIVTFCEINGVDANLLDLWCKTSGAALPSVINWFESVCPAHSAERRIL